MLERLYCQRAVAGGTSVEVYLAFRTEFAGDAKAINTKMQANLATISRRVQMSYYPGLGVALRERLWQVSWWKVRREERRVATA